MKMGAGVKRRTLWVGFAAVLVPLVVLLALQYRWLVQLDHATKKVQKATLIGFLDAVAEKVDYTYRDKARLLDLSSSIFNQNQLHKAAVHFKKKGVEGVTRLFVVSFVNGHDGRPLYFEPSCTSFSTETLGPEEQAVWVATAPWRTLVHKGGIVERVRLISEERDPSYRMLLYPVTDDASRLVGIAGMILDEEHFRTVVLPRAIEDSLSGYFEGNRQYEPIVSVRDGLGEVAFTTAADEKERWKENKVDKNFTFVFTDWSIGLASRHATPAQVARRNFLINIGLSAALAAALLGGLVLSLRTASREMKLSEMKNDFVSNVSHELRTPLASIRVFGEFLRLGRVDNPDKVREYGDYIETESRRLTQLVNNILDFASIESGRKTYRFERCDVRDVVCETLRTFEVRMRQNGFDIVVSGAETPLPPARIDANQHELAILNLAINARDAMPDGGSIDITVAEHRVKREPALAPGRYLKLSVADTGSG
ncbi:sensor histidine kinase, partial [bacterium]